MFNFTGIISFKGNEGYNCNKQQKYKKNNLCIGTFFFFFRKIKDLA